MNANPRTRAWLLTALSAVLLSLPWLVPHAGALALVAFVPLLYAEDLVLRHRLRAPWVWPAAAFVAWNAATTFWVCNATVGGGLFAIFGNAAQMLLVWLLFRLARRRLRGVLPYLFLAVMWIAWERRYFDVDISWPWLTLGGAFAQSTRTVQWYEFTGMLGGSLWVWASNLGIYGLMRAVSGGAWQRWNDLARACAAVGITLVIAGPVVLSKVIYSSYEERSEGTLDVVIGQPNFDPYQKFESLPQARQTEILLDGFREALAGRPAGPVLLLAPGLLHARFPMALIALMALFLVGPGWVGDMASEKADAQEPLNPRQRAALRDLGGAMRDANRVLVMNRGVDFFGGVEEYRAGLRERTVVSRG